MMVDRIEDTERLYKSLALLERQVGGLHLLKDFTSVVPPGAKGVYFIFENGEYRSNHSGRLRVVRVGSHGLTVNSRSTIWTRLFEHLMHNGRSVFRVHINHALKNRAKIKGTTEEHSHSRCISNYIGKMPFLWVQVDGEDSHLVRQKIESNAIALLSNFHGEAADQRSGSWLGRHRDHPNHDKLEKSGLWNIEYVTWKTYKRSFLHDLERCVELTEPIERTLDTSLCLV